MDWLLHDLRHAARGLRHAPAFTTVAILTLALGIGAATALFTAVDGVLLKPLGYTDAARIVAVLNQYGDRPEFPRLTGGDTSDIAAEPGIFDAFAYYYGGEMGVQTGDRAEFVGTELVHPDFFRVFGVEPLAGRPFNRDDAERSAIVSEGFARRNFGTAPAALGRSIFIENRAYDIVGVMPGVMQFPAGTDVWAAAALEPLNRNRSGHNYRAVARLRPDVSIEVANARLSALAGRLAAAYPDTNRDKAFITIPLRDNLVSPVRTTLYLLMAAVGLLLLIACANVANLTLARGAARARDVAVRAALGAARSRILAQALAESAMVAGLACGLGLLLAFGGTRFLAWLGTASVPLPRAHEIQMDWRVLAFSLAIALASTLVCGLMPALHASRFNVKDALGQSGTRGAIGARSSRLRNGLVIAQIALSSVLAINAGLLFRSFMSLTDTPLGFNRENVLVMYAHAPAKGSLFEGSGLDNYLRVGRFFDEVLAGVRQLPNVVSAGGAMGLPTGQYSSNGAYAVEGMHTFGGDFRQLPSAGFRLASPGYFETLGIPLLRGRDFDAGDIYERPFVTIVSQSLAREIFGDEDPIGHRIMCGFDQPDKWMTIVGVVGDVRQASPASRPGPEIYMPLRQHPYAANEVQVAVRTRVAPESLMPSLRALVRAASPDVAMKFTTLDASVSQSIAAPRFRATLVSVFAGLALLLALAGTYAVMSYITAQRMAEFGLRVALGADARAVVRLVLARATRLTLAGMAIGLILALATGRVMDALLFGVTPTDVTTYLVVLLSAMPMIAIAAAVPAMRAARVDPVLSLKSE